MRCWLILSVIVAATFWHSIVAAKVDLVILPKRDSVQLTIYNSADLTLVRERRELTLKKGANRLQFSWANTLIDPTSLEMLPKMHDDEIDILDLVFPSRVQNLGLWHIQSRISGKVPVEITCLTSGLSWRAFYMGTLDKHEKIMRLQGYVRATNNSGEDYEDAQVRLIVGRINVIDQIADLARRQYPHGRPGPVPADTKDVQVPGVRMMAEARREFELAEEMLTGKPKEIRKEGLSEYFLYTIEGRETIPDGWSKRLPSFDVNDIPVINLYKYEEERYGNEVVRFVSFKNDKDHNLGNTPIPGGMLKVYQNLDEAGHLSYVGQSNFRYIPIDEDVELNMGSVAKLIVKPKLMDYKTDRYLHDKHGNISGWDEISEFDIEVKNTREIPVKVEIKRNFNTAAWDLEKSGDFGRYEKVDLDTVKFSLQLNARETKKFRYILTTHHGQRAEQ